jgi:hypothetical protein
MHIDLCSGTPARGAIPARSVFFAPAMKIAREVLAETGALCGGGATEYATVSTEVLETQRWLWLPFPDRHLCHYLAAAR